MSTIGKDVAGGCGRAVVIRAIATVIGVPLACVLVSIPLVLASVFDADPWVLVAAGGLSLLFLLGGAAVFVWDLDQFETY